MLDNNLWHIDLREPLSLFNLAYSCGERDRQINEYVALESINACLCRLFIFLRFDNLNCKVGKFLFKNL